MPGPLDQIMSWWDAKKAQHDYSNTSQARQPSITAKVIDNSQYVMQGPPGSQPVVMNSEDYNLMMGRPATRSVQIGSIQPMPSTLLTRLRDRGAEMFADTLASRDSAPNQDYYNGFRSAVNALSPTDLETGNEVRWMPGGNSSRFIDDMANAPMAVARETPTTRPTMWPDQFAPSATRDPINVGPTTLDKARSAVDQVGRVPGTPVKSSLDMLMDRFTALMRAQQINKSRYKP